LKEVTPLFPLLEYMPSVQSLASKLPRILTFTQQT
jgi:hypothetical protein